MSLITFCVKLICTLKSIFIVICVIIFIRFFFIESFYIPTGSMKPTLVEGDFVFVNKFVYGLRYPFLKKKFLSYKVPQFGDIVVFKHIHGKNYIKRLIGLPGDHIFYRNNFLFINGSLIDFMYCGSEIGLYIDKVPVFFERYEEKLKKVVYNTYKNFLFDNCVDCNYLDVFVPNNCYFVLGDNRNDSNDSRFWGFVYDSELLGKAFIIWLSVDFKQGGFKSTRCFTSL